MAINYPTSLDSLTNPLSTDLLTSPAHSTQHSNVNDAVEALEAKVGADASAVTTSHDYKLGEVTGTDKAVGKTATQTLTNKTLTAPQINMGSDATGDTYYRTAGGAFARLPIGTSGQILQSNASSIPEWIANPAAADSSTTVKGVVEEATQAEVDAGTTAGGTSARLFQNPSTIRAKLLNTGVADTGSANAVAIAPSPAITAYAAYQEFTFKAAASNTGATTINVNSLGTKNIYKNGTSALTGGEIVTGGIYTVVYDGTQFQLINTTSLLTNTVNADEGITSYYTFTMNFPWDATAKFIGWTTWQYMIGSTSGYQGGAGNNYLNLSNNGGTVGAFAPGNGSNGRLQFSANKKWKIKFNAQVNNAAGIMSLGLTDDSGTGQAKIYAAQTDTSVSQMRLVWNSTSIYLTNSNGTNYTATSISGITRTNWNLYEIIYDGTNLLCYVNGVLKATNSTYIPTSSNPAYFVIGGDTINQVMQISPVTMSLEL